MWVSRSLIVVVLECVLIGIAIGADYNKIQYALSELRSLRSTLGVLRDKTELQNRQIQDLRAKTDRQDDQLQSLRKVRWNQADLTERIDVLSRKCSHNHENINRTERLLMQAPPTPISGISDSVVAFYAHMSHVLRNPTQNATLVFDTTFTNSGDGYNFRTGVFTAPGDGIYVFLWKIRIYGAEHSTQLMVNGNVYGATFLRATNGDDGSVTGSVVAHLSEGDHVFVRVHDAYAGKGMINNNLHGHSSFSGWKLN